MTERRGAASALAPRCAVCHDAWAEGEGRAWACPRCGAVLHTDCAADLGRCSTLGCPGVPVPAVDRPLHPVGEALLRVLGWLAGA